MQFYWLSSCQTGKLAHQMLKGKVEWRHGVRPRGRLWHNYAVHQHQLVDQEIIRGMWQNCLQLNHFRRTYSYFQVKNPQWSSGYKLTMMLIYIQNNYLYKIPVTVPIIITIATYAYNQQQRKPSSRTSCVCKRSKYLLQKYMNQGNCLNGLPKTHCMSQNASQTSWGFEILCWYNEIFIQKSDP